MRSSPARSPARRAPSASRASGPAPTRVRITFLGFAPKVQDVAIAPDKPIVDLGTVQLSRVAAHARHGRRRREAGRRQHRARPQHVPREGRRARRDQREPGARGHPRRHRRRRRQGEPARQRERRHPDQRSSRADLAARSSARTSRACPPVCSIASKSFPIRRPSTTPKGWPASSTSCSSRTSISA